MAKVIYETDLVKITKEEHNPSDITIEYKTNKIDYYPTGCSMTQWNEDCSASSIISAISVELKNSKLSKTITNILFVNLFYKEYKNYVE